MINKFDKTTQEILTELEKTQKEFWNISRLTAEFMYILIKAENIQNAVEVGTSNGYSGIWLGKALKETGGHLTTIEYWAKRLDIAKENFKTCGVDEVITTRQGDACEILTALPDDFKVDFAFVDANKREYIKYFEILNSHMKVGGYIACDNVLSHKEKCQPFIDAINANSDYENVVLALPAGLSLARKIK